MVEDPGHLGSTRSFDTTQGALTFLNFLSGWPSRSRVSSIGSCELPPRTSS